MKRSKIDDFPKGFTLIEMLIVIAITALLFAGTTPVLSSFFTKNQLKVTTWEMIDTLKRAQLNAMTGKENEVWGVHFEEEEFILFKGSVYNPSDLENESHFLPQSIGLDEVDLNGGGSEVIFERARGTTQQYGIITLKQGESTQSLSINSQGLIQQL